MMMKLFKYINTIDLIPTLFFLIAAIIWRTSYYVWGLYVMIPTIIVYSWLKCGRYIRASVYWKPYLLLVIWMWLSSAFSVDSAYSFKLMIPVTATFLLSFSILVYSERYNNSRMFALAFICLFVSIMYTTLTGDSYISNFDYANESERRANTEMNSNQYAYFSLFAIMATRLVLGSKVVNRPILRIILYLFLVAIVIFTALLTASRQILVLELPVILFFIYYDFWRNGSAKLRGVLFVVFIFVVVMIVPKVFFFYENSYLAIRASEGIQEDARSSLLMTGFQQGLENPFFGLGLGADTSFSHCTYTHLFARCGFPALILFLYIVINPIKEQYSRFKITRDSYYLLYMFLLIVFSIANFFYSYIEQPFMMTVLFLIVGESNKRFYKSAIV